MTELSPSAISSDTPVLTGTVITTRISVFFSAWRLVVFVKKRVRIGRHVPVVQKRVLLEADVDERRLEIVLEVLDAPLEYAPDEPLGLWVLDHEFLEAAVFKDRDAGFEFFHVYYYFALQL